MLLFGSKAKKEREQCFILEFHLQLAPESISYNDLPLIPEDANSKVFNKDCFRILLAEANELNVKVALRSLEKYKHEISIAKNGNEVITLLKKQSF